jgi:hypothetical protein
MPKDRRRNSFGERRKHSIFGRRLDEDTREGFHSVMYEYLRKVDMNTHDEERIKAFYRFLVRTGRIYNSE